jgi:hypothetical protein
MKSEQSFWFESQTLQFEIDGTTYKIFNVVNIPNISDKFSFNGKNYIILSKKYEIYTNIYSSNKNKPSCETKIILNLEAV